MKLIFHPNAKEFDLLMKNVERNENFEIKNKNCIISAKEIPLQTRFLLQLKEMQIGDKGRNVNSAWSISSKSEQLPGRISMRGHVVLIVLCYFATYVFAKGSGFTLCMIS
jgi:hypothetical protein